MQVVAAVAVGVHHLANLVVRDKLLAEPIAPRRLVVGVRQIGDCHRLTAMLGPDPVGVGQVDADGRSRIFVAAEHGRTDRIGRDPLYFWLAEARIHGRVVLKPLCAVRNGTRAACGLLVAIFDDSLPRTFQSQWVAIDLDETVDEVDAPLVVIDPRDAISVEVAQVARLIVVDEQVDDAALSLALGILPGFLQPIDDLFYGRGIFPADFPNLLLELSVPFDERGVESP